MIINRIKNKFNRKKIAKEWRRINQHNKTSMKGVFNSSHVSVGRETYGELKVVDFAGKEAGARLNIGNFCSIAGDVTFVLNGEHSIHTLSTFPFKVQTLACEKYEAKSKGDIVINDDVWIGEGVTILSGITVGQGAILASKALITRDVPPYAIVGGIPAKVIGYRFDEEIIQKLQKFDYSKLSDSLIRENIDLLYTRISKDFFESELYRKCKRV